MTIRKKRKVKQKDVQPLGNEYIKKKEAFGFVVF